MNYLNIWTDDIENETPCAFDYKTDKIGEIF